MPRFGDVSMELHIQYREPIGLHRFRQESHVSLLRSSATLLPVTRCARAHDIFPGGLATLTPWHHVVEGCFLAVHLKIAILAPKAVSRQHVRPRKRRGATPYPEKPKQPNNRWGLYSHRYRANVVVVFLNDLDLTQEKESDGILPGDNLQRFVGGAEK